MIIEKSVIASAIKKLKGLTVNGQDIGILVDNGYVMARSEVMGIKIPIGNANGEKFIIPPQALAMIDNMPNGNIEINERNGKIIVKQGKIKSQYNAVKSGSFPSIPWEYDNINPIKLNSTVFCKAVDSVSYAAGEHLRKPQLNSVYLDIKTDKVYYVATDSYRIARYSVENTTGIENFSVIIPKAVALKLSSLLEDNVTIELYKANNKAYFITEKFALFTQLLSGEYLAYDKVMIDRGTDININRKLFEETLKRVNLISTSVKSSPLPCCCKFDSAHVSVSTANASADYIEDIPTVGNCDIEIGFNSRYILDTIKNMKCDDIRLNLSAPQAGMLVHSISDNEEITALVLPVKLH